MCWLPWRRACCLLGPSGPSAPPAAGPCPPAAAPCPGGRATARRVTSKQLTGSCGQLMASRRRRRGGGPAGSCWRRCSDWCLARWGVRRQRTVQVGRRPAAVKGVQPPCRAAMNLYVKGSPSQSPTLSRCWRLYSAGRPSTTTGGWLGAASSRRSSAADGASAPASRRGSGHADAGQQQASPEERRQAAAAVYGATWAGGMAAVVQDCLGGWGK